jgi:hypothetical protein
MTKNAEKVEEILSNVVCVSTTFAMLPFVMILGLMLLSHSEQGCVLIPCNHNVVGTMCHITSCNYT